MRSILRASLIGIVLATGLTCESVPVALEIPSFADFPLLRFDGRAQQVTSAISRLGFHEAGAVLKITVSSDQARAAYILQPDDEPATKGVIIGGGPVMPTQAVGDSFFLHRVQADGDLFLFIDGPDGTVATVVLGSGPPSFHPPTGQTVVLEFEDSFLVNGLFDPGAPGDDEADRQFLIAIEPTVRAGIIARVREIYEGTPVTILAPGDPRPEQFSVLTVSGESLINAGDSADVIEVRSDNGECQFGVVFGEVLPRGRGVDPGNQDPTDRAIVYAGSFRPPPVCGERSFVLDSVSNIINVLSLSCAHEIGHLLGLNHTALEGLMAQRPSSAFQRQLRFQRSQLTVSDGNVLSVATLVIQDPQTYFRNIFSP